MKRKILAFILYYSGIVWIYLLWLRIIGSKKLRIITYHRVMDFKPDKYEYNVDLIDSTIKEFERQIRFVSKHFNIVTFNKISKFKKKGVFDNNLLIITFDDGYKDNNTNAYMILKKYNISATIFLSTGYVESENIFWWDRIAYIVKKTDHLDFSITVNGVNYNFDISSYDKKNKAIKKIIDLIDEFRLEEINDILMKLENRLNIFIEPSANEKLILSWNEIIEMSHNGIEFCSHTVHHPRMTNLSLNEIKNEVINSKMAIEEKTLSKSIAFAYPYGPCNDECISVLNNTGIEFACLFNHRGLNKIKDLYEHPYELKRIQVDNDQGMFMFKTKICFPKLV